MVSLEILDLYVYNLRTKKVKENINIGAEWSATYYTLLCHVYDQPQYYFAVKCKKYEVAEGKLLVNIFSGLIFSPE